MKVRAIKSFELPKPPAGKITFDKGAIYDIDGERFAEMCDGLEFDDLFIDADEPWLEPDAEDPTLFDGGLPVQPKQREPELSEPSGLEEIVSSYQPLPEDEPVEEPAPEPSVILTAPKKRGKKKKQEENPED